MWQWTPCIAPSSPTIAQNHPSQRSQVSSKAAFKRLSGLSRMLNNSCSNHHLRSYRLRSTVPFQPVFPQTITHHHRITKMQFSNKSMQQFSRIPAMMDSAVRHNVRDEADVQKVLDYYSPIRGLKVDSKKQNQEDFWTYASHSPRIPAQPRSNIQKGETQLAFERGHNAPPANANSLYSLFPRHPAYHSTPVGGSVDYEAIIRAPKVCHREVHKPMELCSSDSTATGSSPT
jgi:hypothetical protein